MKTLEMATLAELRKLRKEVAGLTAKIESLLEHPPGKPCVLCNDNGAMYDPDYDRFKSCPKCPKGEALRQAHPGYDRIRT